MSTCTRCGQPNRPEAVACVVCGSSLSFSPSAPTPAAADDGLPPWLRNRQAGPPPASSGYGQPAAAPYEAPTPAWRGLEQPPRNMQASELVNADELPEWLRNVASGPLTPQSPPAGNGWPAPAGYGQPMNPAGAQYLPGAGNVMRARMSGPLGSAPSGTGAFGSGQPASALFDESALPAWLRQAAQGQEMDAAQSASQQAPGYGAPAGMAARGMDTFAYNGYLPQQAPAPRAPDGSQRQPPAQSPTSAQASAFPSIEQAGAYRPAPTPNAGIPGHSLLDPNALPAWMGGQPAPFAPNGSGSGMLSNPGGMSAQSLVDESALPQWLRAEPNTPAAPPPPQYGTPAGPAVSPSPRSSDWLAAPVAAEPLPQWLDQVYADAHVARVEPRPAGTPMVGGMSGRLVSPAYGTAQNGAATPGGSLPNTFQPISGGTVSASDFVDESALPEWLKSQGAMGTDLDSSAPPNAYTPPAMYSDGTVPAHRVAPVYRPAQEPGDAPPAGFAASDLIDPSALPSWVSAQEPPQEQSFSSASGWTVKQPAAPPRQPSNGGDPSYGYADAGAHPGGSGVLRRPESRELDRQSEHDENGHFAEADNDSWQSANLSRGHSRSPLQHDGPRAYNGSFGRMPDPESEPQYPGNGIGKRRDAPIPSRELPPWLQSANSEQRGGPSYPDRGARGRPGNAPAWENSAPDAEPQWSDWDDEPNGASRQSQRDAHARQSQYDGEPEREQNQRGGLRRFFRRK